MFQRKIWEMTLCRSILLLQGTKFKIFIYKKTPKDWFCAPELTQRETV